MCRCCLVQICRRFGEICYHHLLLVPWSWRQQMKSTQTFIYLRFFLKEIKCLTSASQTSPPQHCDIHHRIEAFARHGIFHPKYRGAWRTKKTFTTRHRYCELPNTVHEEMFSELPIKRAHLECRCSELYTRKALHIPLPTGKNSRVPWWRSTYRRTGKKSIVLQNTLCVLMRTNLHKAG
jgi:hypothetical protein